MNKVYDGLIASDWMDRFRTQGYVVVRQLLPHDLIDLHVSALEDIWRRYGVDKRQSLEPDMADSLSAEIKALHFEHEPSLRLCLTPALRTLAQEILEEEPVLSIAYSHRWSLAREPHRDAGLVYHDPPEKTFRTWAALENIDADVGPIYLVPGTHKKAHIYDDLLRNEPHLRQALNDLAKGSMSSKEWEQKRAPLHKSISAHVERELADGIKEPIILRKGDALLFDLRLIHGTMPCCDKNRTRRAMILDWRSRSSRSYFASAYFGKSHDYRRPANSGPGGQIMESPFGPYLVFDKAAALRWLQQRTVGFPAQSTG